MDRATDDTLQAWLKIANNIIEIFKKIVTFQVNMFFFVFFRYLHPKSSPLLLKPSIALFLKNPKFF